MFEFFIEKLTKRGAAPGSLVYVGRERSFAPRVRLTAYAPDVLDERALDPAGPAPSAPPGGTALIRVTGVHDAELVRQVGAWFGIPALVLEDVLNTGHRPKIEEIDGVGFAVLKAVSYDADARRVVGENVCLAWKDGWVVVFQESETEHFPGVTERLARGKGRIRQAGPIYLAVALMDELVDVASLALDRLGQDISMLEDQLFEKLRRETVEETYLLTREVIRLRDAIAPVKDMLGQMLRGEVGEVPGPARNYLRDVRDHAAEAAEALRSYHELLSGMINLHISLAGLRTNQVMQVLTIVATIFIPLTFLAGIYGMNFDVMPELHWPWAYPAFLALMVALALGMVLWFRRRGWF